MIEFVLQRKPSAHGATLGELTRDGAHICYTCEDVIREVKIPGETCIPPGRYSIIVTWSPHFQRELPLLVDVPGFSGVRIHSGNTAADTEGCILVGKTLEEAIGAIGHSREAFNELFAVIENGSDMWITINNPEGA